MSLLPHTPDPPQPAAARYLGSIRSLLTVAAQETAAEGFAFYEFDQAKRQLHLRLRQGLPSPQPGSSTPTAITFPLQGPGGLAGVADFIFRHARPLETAHHQALQTTADAIQHILLASARPASLFDLTVRIGELEAELAGRKISERAEGLLHAENTPGRAQLLRDHVANVLSFRHVESTLTAHLRDLEQRLEHRNIVAGAKALLQTKHGYTEEEAYLSLREASRRSRTPLKTIAERVVAGRS